MRGLSLDIQPGETVALVGESGSGKSVSALAGIRLLGENARCSGRICWKGVDIFDADEDVMRDIRGNDIGMVFQEIHLVESLSVWQNLDLLARASRSGADVGKLLDVFGLTGLARKSVRLLSRGERQRVGIARALVNLPKLVLADEPTSSLDPDRRTECLSRLWEWCSSHNTSVVMVSHDSGVMGSGVFTQQIALP